MPQGVVEEDKFELKNNFVQVNKRCGGKWYTRRVFVASYTDVFFSVWVIWLSDAHPPFRVVDKVVCLFPNENICKEKLIRCAEIKFLSKNLHLVHKLRMILLLLFLRSKRAAYGVRKA